LAFLHPRKTDHSRRSLGKIEAGKLTGLLSAPLPRKPEITYWRVIVNHANDLDRHRLAQELSNYETFAKPTLHARNRQKKINRALSAPG
jgi:hypothetical protein